MTESVSACDFCSKSDKWIVAAMAQNSAVSIVDVKKFYNPSKGIDWQAYLNSLGVGIGGRGLVQLNVAGIKSWARFQIWVFAAQLQELVKRGWEIDDPQIIPYLQCIALDQNDCKPPPDK